MIRRLHRRSVDFGAETLLQAFDGRVFVECGPRSALAAAVRQTLEGRPHLAISFDQAGTTPDRQAARIAAALGVAPDDIVPRIHQAISAPVKPVQVANGRVQEVVVT